ncbi:hypothetical protein [Isoptericola sp. NPDC019482]|uniref:hypothetical protein n=1 Tax=Isoptericola sp. NPDC019482 TaxID=3154688 RepID=UPI00348E0F98
MERLSRPYRRTVAPVVVTVVAALAALAACTPGAAPAPPPAGVPSPTATATHGRWPPDDHIEQPPPFEVRYGDRALLLYAFTFCHAGGCADGVDEDPPSVGSAAELFVRVPVPELTALDVAAAPPGPRGDVEHLGDGWWRVDLTDADGAEGEHRVSIMASSASGGGDMVAEVLWSAPG